MNLRQFSTISLIRVAELIVCLCITNTRQTTTHISCLVTNYIYNQMLTNYDFRPVGLENVEHIKLFFYPLAC